MLRAMGFCDNVRAACAAVVADARWVTIDRDALEAYAPPAVTAELQPEWHFLEGGDEAVAAYVLTLDAINFGSGWFPTLRGPAGLDGYFVVSSALAERFRAHGQWDPGALRAMTTREVADVLGQPRDHELMALYAQALRELGGWLGDRGALEAVEYHGAGSAERLAAALAGGMTMWTDTGFFKRAQIAANDLALAGVATFRDLDRLTIFADNLLPHVLRRDGVLRLDPALAAHLDAGELLRAGRQERELRAAAVVAAGQLARRLGITERELDGALWLRGQGRAYREPPPHRTRTIFY
jgi:hypothetical protein